MPFCEADPWRLQYFEGVTCPSGLRIPTEDPDAHLWNPSHRWIYNKLAVAESQGLACAPHGVRPPEFPVFSKPITNLRGMGAGSRVLPDLAHYQRHMTPGHFWMTLLEGEHVSSDITVVVRGAAAWWRHCRGTPAAQGTFDYWTIEASTAPSSKRYFAAWISQQLADYTGMLNLETIGGRIIEAHLRFADQWPDLYGRQWLDAVVRLYGEGRWEFADGDRRGVQRRPVRAARARIPPPEPTAARGGAALPQVTSVQITFHEDRPAAAHPMPPGGFRQDDRQCLGPRGGQSGARHAGPRVPVSSLLPTAGARRGLGGRVERLAHDQRIERSGHGGRQGGTGGTQTRPAGTRVGACQRLDAPGAALATGESEAA